MPNTYDLAGKFAVVTGGARGIGRAIGELLLDSGCEVAIWDVNLAPVRSATAVLVDITQPEQIAAAVSALPANSRVDILVNDAGYLGKTTNFVEHSPADWRHIVQVNLVGM